MVLKLPLIVTLFSSEIVADWVGVGVGHPWPSAAVSETPGGTSE